MKRKSSIAMKLITYLFIFLPVFCFAQKPDGQILIEQFLLKNKPASFSPGNAETINVTRDYVDATTGIRHIYANQVLNGFTVIDGGYALHVKGEKMMDADNLMDVGKIKVRPAIVSISAQQAINNAMTEIGYNESRLFSIKKASAGKDFYTVFSRNSSPVWDIPVRMVYYNYSRAEALVPAWEVQMMDVFKKHYWQIFVDAADGKILYKKDLIVHCDFGAPYEDDFLVKGNIEINTKSNLENLKPILSPLASSANSGLTAIANTYKVYDQPYESPIDFGAVHANVTTAGTFSASPDGWHRVDNSITYQYTRGNNVWAFQDPSPGPLGGVPSSDPSRTAYANNGVGGTPPLTEPFGFDYPVNLNNQPETYQNGAITNLFYWNNLIHDVFYQFGFDEVGGNFESSHLFSTGLKGSATDNSNDEVFAQAQDGGGTNNANFLTLPDGINGQMQMYLWTGSLPDSLVQIAHSSTNIPPDSLRYYAIQGSFAGPVQGDLYTNPVFNKPLVIVQKNQLSTVGSSSEGCSSGQQSVALPPDNNVTDKIVLIDRGSCSFVEKVLGAQEGGAAGVIIINNTPGEPIAMGGSDAPGNAITIPSVMVSQDVGTFLKAQLNGGATINASLKRKVPAAKKRDGDLDNGVIAHEYGHGISTRLTGGPDGGSLGGSEQGGEGWSDFIGLYMTMRSNDLNPASGAHVNGVLPTRSIGNYVTYQAQDGRGIRPRPYSIDLGINELTFQNINDGGEISVPHGVGSIWCTMLYEVMQEMIDIYPINDDIYNAANPSGNNVPAGAGGNNVAMRLVIEGLKLQPNSPTFVQMRDAILKADTLLYNAQHACVLWRAFAKRGLGFFASSGTNALNDEVEAFNVPLTCDPTQKYIKILKTGPTLINNNTAVSYTITVQNRYATAATGVTLRDTLSAVMTYMSAVPAPTAISGKNLEWTFDLAANETKTYTVTVNIVSPTSSTKIFSDDMESGTANWVASTIPPGGAGPWTYTTNAANAFSGTKYWYAKNIGLGGQNSVLTTANQLAVPPNAVLVFIHKYATEAAYDGGVIEISSDNGINWTYLPNAKFISGGYNGIITTTNNPNIGSANLAAFTGASPGYITSIASLSDYAGMNIKFRFRMVSDATGVTVDGWYVDDVSVLSNVVTVTNSATARAKLGDPIRETEGSNARNAANGFVIGLAVLPLGLGDLNASLVDKTVKLEWSNQNDAEARNYYVERKGINDADFVTIGNVGAKGLSGNQVYGFVDTQVSDGGQYTYRISVEKIDGQKLFTNTAFVRLNAKEFTLSVYPNPARNVVTMTISNPVGNMVNFRIFDIMGKQIGLFNAGSGKNIKKVLPVQNLANGAYWIEISNGENTATSRLIISR